MLSESDIERRAPVWQAMSGLFLDTEISLGDYQALALSLAGSGFSRSELRDIFLHQAAPAFFPNLLVVAGEWQYWSEDEARDIVLKCMRGRQTFPPFYWLRRWFSRRHARAEWEKIMAAWPQP